MTGMMDANWGGVIAPAVGAGKPNAAPSTLQSKDRPVANPGSTLVLKSALSSRKRKKETYLNTGRKVRFNLNHVRNRPNLGQETEDIYQRHRSYALPQRLINLSNTGSNMMEVLQLVLDHKENALPRSAFQFELSESAAQQNWEYICKCGGIKEALDKDRESITGAGSEFRPAPILEQLLSLHPLWERFQRTITCGSHFAKQRLSQEEKKSDRLAVIARGNHKGATANPEALRTLVKGDVLSGFAFPIPLSHGSTLNDAVIGPMNVIV